MQDNKIIAFFSISNDCLNDLGDGKGYSNKIWNRFHRKVDIPNHKRIRHYPAIKIGRLGVCNEYQKTGLAYELMDFIKGWIIIGLKAACRLLLLDAYNKPRQISYYQNNGFKFLLDDDVNDKNRIMYFDLTPLFNE
jgi:GNAT superfamily N-acetyltransferase